MIINWILYRWRTRLPKTLSRWMTQSWIINLVLKQPEGIVAACSTVFLYLIKAMGKSDEIGVTLRSRSAKRTSLKLFLKAVWKIAELHIDSIEEVQRLTQPARLRPKTKVVMSIIFLSETRWKRNPWLRSSKLKASKSITQKENEATTYDEQYFSIAKFVFNKATCIGSFPELTLKDFYAQLFSSNFLLPQMEYTSKVPIVRLIEHLYFD